jgi:hypothetical protein
MSIDRKLNSIYSQVTRVKVAVVIARSGQSQSREDATGKSSHVPSRLAFKHLITTDLAHLHLLLNCMVFYLFVRSVSFFIITSKLWPGAKQPSAKKVCDLLEYGVQILHY